MKTSLQKQFVVSLLTFILSLIVFFSTAQPATTANYSVSTNNSASLVTMTGSEQLIIPNQNNVSSNVENLAFDFWFMGVRYNNFTASSNGIIRFGTSILSATQTGYGFPISAANGAILAPFAADLKTSTTGQVHSVVTGSAPNRKCTIEFLNMGLGGGSSSVDGTFQVILNETTGIIQYIYGGMKIANTTGVSGTQSAVIGLSSDNVNTKTLSLNHTSFAVNTNTPATKNSYTATGIITSLNSAADGSRREIKFTPPVLQAPSLPTVTLPTSSSLTVNWVGVSVSNEQGFVIYKSDDGGFTYDFAFQTAADATSALITNLLAGTTYIFKVYSVSEGALSSSISVSGTTTTCGAGGTNILSLTGSGPYTWSTLASSWSLSHLPTSCEDAVIDFNRSSGGDETSSLPTLNNPIILNIDVDIAVNSLTVNNKSTSTNVKSLSISGYGRVYINGDLVITCQGANKYDRCVFSTQNKTVINGNLILSRPANSQTANEGQSAIGSNGSSREQLFLLRGNMTFNKRSYTTDEHANFTFDKAGTQYLYNFTTPQPFPYVQGVGDTLQAVLFEKLVVGNANASNLVFAGTSFDGYMEGVSREGITIGINSTLDLPQNFSISPLGGSSYFRMLSGAKLRLGGDQIISPNGIIYGVPGSNFPASFSPYTFNPTSTIEYYGSNGITQTIYNGVTYANLLATNGSGSGRAIKQTTAGTLNVNSSFNINSLADVYLGTSTGLGTSTAPVTSTGPLNINAGGGLYCNANQISGGGAFTMGNGSFLGMGHPQGISNSGSATGNIIMTGGRTYNTSGNYIYNGTVSQTTGAGLPTTINDLTIDNANIVTIATNQIINGVDYLKQGTFDIGSTKITHNGLSTITSLSGKMKADHGAVEMRGTSTQNISGSWFLNKNISSLINSNTTGITVAASPADTLLISSALLFGTTNSVINTNNNLTFLSRDSATARFGPIGTGNDITGQVTIERYMPAKKSWRLLAAPVANGTSPFVSASWREGGSMASTGYGTRITGPAGFVGVDEYTQRASMKFYDGTLNNYVDVSNTTTKKIGNTNTGYYVFVRGDRGVAVTGAAASTILRIKGDIQKGGQTVSVPAGKFITLGNPYPSGINFKTVSKTNISNTFYVWNPNSAGNYNVGAFENYTYNTTTLNYEKVPGGTVRNTIQSGEAIFIQSNGAAGSVTVNETDKVGGITSPVSRSSSAAREGVPTPTLKVNLYTNNTDGTSYLADGVLMNFDDNFSTKVDNEDVRKISNAGDNLAIKNDGNFLIVERRPTLTVADTIKFNLANTRINPYRLEIDPSALGGITLSPSLQDKFLGTTAPISFTDITKYSFDITADAASRAADRFMIVFKQVSPTRFTKITAVRNKENTATINWYIENENNIDTYVIEHSNDGVNFTEIGRQMPTTNNNGNPYYSFVDAKPTEAVNFYRINAMPIRGNPLNTDIAKIAAKEIKLPTAISIYPNPVTQGYVHVNFVNEAIGKYQLSISNMVGQTIYTEVLHLKNNNLQKIIELGSAAAGSYNLIVKDDAGNTKKISFIVK